MLDDIDLKLIECMYDEDRIGRHHGNVERILDICTPRNYRKRYPISRLKKRMRQLASQGYMIRKVGRFEAFSLTQRGVVIAERVKSGWTLDHINAEETAD